MTESDSTRFVNLSPIKHTLDHFKLVVSDRSMAELPSREAAEPPVVAAASIASTANAGAVEQKIDPWSVSAAIDEQGNSLAFDYEAISRYAHCGIIPTQVSFDFVLYHVLTRRTR